MAHIIWAIEYPPYYMNDEYTLISGGLWSAWNILSSFVHGVSSFFNAFVVMFQWETIFLDRKHVIGIWSVLLFHQVDQRNHFEFCATAEEKFIDFIWYGPYYMVHNIPYLCVKNSPSVGCIFETHSVELQEAQPVGFNNFYKKCLLISDLFNDD